MAQLNPKDIKIIKGKVAGKNNREIGREVYPNATPESQSVLVNRQLKKVNVAEAIQAEFKKQGIDLETVLAPVAKALKSKRTFYLEGTKFETDDDDLEMQLKGHDRAAKLMGLTQQTSGEVNITFIDASQHQKADYDL